MAIWKEMNRAAGSAMPLESPRENGTTLESRPSPARQSADAKDSVIGAGLLIEGKIEGDGDIHIGGTFKGDVRVNGDVTVEPGARVSAEISAGTVTVGGQIDGNISATTQVKLLQSGQLIGDLKAKSLTVAAGSRMRGRVEFGWDEPELRKIELNVVRKADNNRPTV
jgi:cytoskeletal protein CcmA (bactofilin family)